MVTIAYLEIATTPRYLAAQLLPLLLEFCLAASNLYF